LSWYLAYIKSLSLPLRRLPPSAKPESENVQERYRPPSRLRHRFGRLLVKLDGLLMAWAESNIRNGDVPYIGL
jgi:hypothetical protein